MKFIFLLSVLVLSSSIWAQNKTGLGVSLGNPTGLNGKYWLDETKAVDAGLGFSIGKHSNFSIHSDYLFHNKGAFYFNDVHPLDLFYGIGGRMEFADDIEVGVRVPVGLVYEVEEKSADVFGEVAPVIDFLTNTGVELHILIGSRYYF